MPLPEYFDLQKAVSKTKNTLWRFPSSWLSKTSLFVFDSLDILTFLADYIVALKKILKHL